MLRNVLLRSARSATAQVVRRSGAIARPIAPSSLVTKSQFAPSLFQAARCYSAAAGLGKQEVEGRIVDLLKNFDKVRAGIEMLESSLMLGRSRIQQRYTWETAPLGFGIDCLQLTPTSHFSNDLGLDSLDTVEVVMAIEEVFADARWNGLALMCCRNSVLRSRIRMRMPFSVVC